MNRLYSGLTLEAFDRPWQEMLRTSLVLTPLAAVKAMMPSLPQVANWLQMAGFVAALILFAVMGHQHFADDKNGLAVIALGGFALWFGGYVLGGKERRTPIAIDALVLMYLAANIVSTAASHYLTSSIHGLEKVVVYVATYFYLTGLLQHDRKRRIVLFVSVLAITGLAISLYGFWQYHMHVEPLATWEDPTVESKGTRIFSTLRNPNLLAGYLLPLIALVASLGMAAISKGWSDSKGNSTSKLIVLGGFASILISLALAVATVLTGCRGGYLGLFATVGAIGFVVVAMFWKNNAKLRVPAIGGVIVVALLGMLALHFVPGFEQRITSIFSGSEHSSNNFRMNVWRASFAMLKDNWWFGIGPGNQTFILAYGLYMTSGFDALGTYCVPLEVAVETGLIGLAAFGSLILVLCARGHVYFWTEPGWSKWLAAGAAAALIGMMVHGLVDTVFYRPQVQFIFWLLVAILAVSSGASPEAQTQANLRQAS